MVSVYLDSQDFSRFSKRHKDYAKFASLKAELLALKQNGHVTFVFSDIHIYEVFPKNHTANEEGLDRIRTIAELCGKQSMPSFVSLIEHEVHAALSKITGRAPPALSHNWFPDLGIANEPLERENIRRNRKERRFLERQVRKRNSPFMVEARNKYPFIKDSSLFYRYYVHEAEWSDVVKMIENGMQDIKSFVSWIANSNKTNFNLPDILRGGYAGYVDAVQTIREEVAKRVSALESMDQRDKLAKEIGSAIEKSLVELRSSIPRKLIDDLKDYPCPVVVDESMPSFDALLRYLAELIRRSSQLSTPRKPIGSDLADALHVCYLPRVDIFRTDVTAADVVARVYPERKGDILGDIFKLPALIMEKTKASID